MLQIASLQSSWAAAYSVPGDLNQSLTYMLDAQNAQKTSWQNMAHQQASQHGAIDGTECQWKLQLRDNPRCMHNANSCQYSCATNSCRDQAMHGAHSEMLLGSARNPHGSGTYSGIVYTPERQNGTWSPFSPLQVMVRVRICQSLACNHMAVVACAKQA